MEFLIRAANQLVSRRLFHDGCSTTAVPRWLETRSGPGGSEFGVCLHDRDFELYLDDILERQDFSRCQKLVMSKRFGWDQEACTDFDPVEDLGVECSPELAAKIGALAKQEGLTGETIEGLIQADHVDWSRAPVDSCVDNLGRAFTAEQRHPVLRQLGALVANGNRGAIDETGVMGGTVDLAHVAFPGG